MQLKIITSFTPGIDINEKFHRSLHTFKDHWGAEIKYVKNRENYKRDIQGYEKIEELESNYEWGTISLNANIKKQVETDCLSESEAQDEMYEILKTEIYEKYNFNKSTEVLLKRNSGGVRLNQNLTISDYEVNCNLIDPISGLDPLAAKEGNLIIGATRQRFKTVPRSLKHSTTPRAIWCTGTISKPYYKKTKSGKLMSPYHQYGALLVMIESDTKFHIRQLQANPDGSFYDLRYLYCPNGDIYEIDGVEGFALGDLHPPFHHKGVMKSRLDLMKQLNPKNVFYHDWLDCCSISHHIESKRLTKALIRDKFPTFESECDLTAGLISKYANNNPFAKHYMVPSNHPDHLVRYLEEQRYMKDPTNEIFGSELASQYIKYRRGISNISPMEFAIRQFKDLPNVIFTKRKDSVICAGNEMNNHGDYGSNGAKGTSRSQGVLFNGMCVTGHTHSPEMGVFNNPVVGTSTKLSMPYTNDSGGSGWLHSDVVVYPSGTKTHIHYISE